VRILLVEDEIGIADFVLRALRADGHTVQHVSDGIEGERRGVAGGVDLVILDITLPGRNGLEVLGAIRRIKPGLPVIMLTARGEVADKVAKPFSVEELLARVRVHLRPPQHVEPTELSAFGIHVDLLRRSVARDGTQVALSAKEFELLVYFLRHPSQVLSREQILGAVWSYDHDPGTNIVEVYVGYLRRKLNVGGEPAPIETVRSVGYRLAGN
jgi:DNA-binding response OmpR family regulator